MPATGADLDGRHLRKMDGIPVRWLPKTTGMQTNIDLVKRYLAALEQGDAGDALIPYFTADAIQTEFPNRLNSAGQVSDVPSIIERSLLGLKVLQSQHFEIVSIVAQDDRVAVEAGWTGVLAIPVGTLPAGGVMKAHFAMFFECADGRIRRQRNYDCFEAW